MITQAVILAGGIGSRLGEVTKRTPKPVLPVDGRPFLTYLFGNLKRYGLTRVVLSVGYLADRIVDELKDGRSHGIEIVYAIEPERLGTGGGVRFASKYLDNEFMVFNGDTLFDFNYRDLTQRLTGDLLGAIALRRVNDVSRYGSVRLDGAAIRAFDEKAEVGGGFINGGVYVLRKAALDLLPAGASSLEHDLFPQLAGFGRLAGTPYDGYFIDIGLPETLEAAQIELPGWQSGIRQFT